MKKISLTLLLVLLVCLQSCTTKQQQQEEGIIMTVNGAISKQEMGVTLTHEHILVDFIGAEEYDNQLWDKNSVIARVLPFLQEIKALGCQTFIDAAPEYLGRDPLLFRELSRLSGLHIITNTGLYGAINERFLPAYAFTETAEQLAARWIAEWKDGINGTGIRPGFIKIGVDGGNLSELHQKLVAAAAKTHLESGLVIASHTGPAIPAFEQIEILKQHGVSPEAFIWAHAQAAMNEPEMQFKAAEMGAWVSLDGLDENNVQDYVMMISRMKDKGLLHRVLLSHDAGWYDPRQENGGNFRGFTTLFTQLLPQLREVGFSDEDIHQLMVINPANAFEVRVRK